MEEKRATTLKTRSYISNEEKDYISEYMESFRTGCKEIKIIPLGCKNNSTMVVSSNYVLNHLLSKTLASKEAGKPKEVVLLGKQELDYTFGALFICSDEKKFENQSAVKKGTHVVVFGKDFKEFLRVVKKTYLTLLEEGDKRKNEHRDWDIELDQSKYYELIPHIVVRSTVFNRELIFNKSSEFRVDGVKDARTQMELLRKIYEHIDSSEME